MIVAKKNQGSKITWEKLFRRVIAKRVVLYDPLCKPPHRAKYKLVNMPKVLEVLFLNSVTDLNQFVEKGMQVI